MVTRIATGEMLQEFTFELMNLQLWSAEPLKTHITDMCESKKCADGSVAIIIRADIRTLLFREQTREHLETLINLIKDGITGTAALEQALWGATSPAVASGVL